MNAAFVASFIRTGHLDTPIWRAIRYTLHKWLWGKVSLQRAIDLLEGQGYSRLLAYTIANEFSKQCKARNSFTSYADDNSIYELPIERIQSTRPATAAADDCTVGSAGSPAPQRNPFTGNLESDERGG